MLKQHWIERRINMIVKFLKEVVITDQNNDKQKIKNGTILSAEMSKDEDGKDQYEIKRGKNVFIMGSAMKDVVFTVL